MAEVGYWGKPNGKKTIQFIVSDVKILTYSGMSHTASGRWAAYERIGKKPRSAFLGPGLREASFTMYVSAGLGVDPWKFLRKLRKAAEKGKVAPLVFGGKYLGGSKAKWYIESMPEDWESTTVGGKLASATVQVKMREYR